MKIPAIRMSGSRGTGLSVWFLLGILLFFLLAEHRAHLFGALPWLLLLACLLLHRFMHRSHGDDRIGHHGEGRS